MTRDFAVDSLPSGFLWDLVDAIPNRKGARIEQRGGWSYLGASTALPAAVQGGYQAAFKLGDRLLMVGNSKVYNMAFDGTSITEVTGGAPATMIQNGAKLNDRVYFFDGAGGVVPRIVQLTAGPTLTNTAMDASAPKAKVGIAYKGRLAVGGDPANPSRVSFSRLEDDPGGIGPTQTWDALSWIGTNNAVTGLAPMAGQILVFHPAAIERIRGSVPPETDVDTDMFVEPLTEQVGCTLPHTIVAWRENIIFADEHGVFLTDGSTVRNLIELGGMGDFWRLAYGSKNATQGVSCGIFLDYLMVTLNCTVSAVAVNFTLICDLSTRSWFRFTNFPAACYVPSETASEQLYVGHVGTHKTGTVSSMFQDPVPIPNSNDYEDGNAVSVLPSFTTGFERLDKGEGEKRLRSIFLSYHHQSFEGGRPTPDGVKVEYRTDPPTPEDVDGGTGSVTGWTEAGRVPDTDRYTRKKVLVGKRGYGIMVRVTSLTPSRINRFFALGVETTSQDKAKVTV